MARTSIDPTVPLALAAAAVFGALRLRPLDTPDLWWHLSMGRAAIENAARRFPDPTGPDPAREYVAPEWLFDATLSTLWDAAGLHGVFALVALCGAASLLAVWGLARACLRPSAEGVALPSAHAWTALVLALLAAGGSQLRITPRPQAWFLVLLPMVLLAVVRSATATGRREALGWAATAIAGLAIWSQSHSSIAIAPAVVLATPHLLWGPGRPESRGPRREDPAVVLLVAAALLAPLLGPFGLELVVQVLSHAGTDAAHHIVDMAPPKPSDFWPFRPLGDGAWGPRAAFLEVLLLVGAFGLLRAGRAAVPAVPLAVLGVLLVMTANRFLAVSVILAVPLASTAALPIGGVRRGGPAVLLGAALAVAATSWAARVGRPGLVADAEPRAVGDALDRLDPRGVVFNHFDVGGYLGFRGLGRYRVFIDGRTPTHFDEAWFADWRAANRGGPAWSELDAAHAFEVAVVRGRDGVCRDLDSDPEWSLHTWSPHYTVFVRAPREPSALLPCGGPFAQVDACRTRSDLVERLAAVDRALLEDPDHDGMARLGVLLALECGAAPLLERAAGYLEVAAAARPRHADLPWLSALLAARSGDGRAAFAALEDAPWSPAVAALRLEILRAAFRADWAREVAEDAVERLGDQVDVQTLDHLAWACDQTGDRECGDRARAAAAAKRRP